MKKIGATILLLLIYIVNGNSIGKITFNKNDLVKGFYGGVFKDTNNFEVNYRLFIPKIEKNKKYPLILHFHGAGSWGDDNKQQLSWASRILNMAQKITPCFMLAPQTKRKAKWVNLTWSEANHKQPLKATPQMIAVVQLLKEVMKKYPIDRSRIYVNGQSMGGYATWDIICRYPELFAAAIPVCGGGDVEKMDLIKNMPIWAFHGELDKSVPVKNSQDLVNRLKQYNAPVKYTQYPNIAHASWVNAYENKELFIWLLKQKKEN